MSVNRFGGIMGKAAIAGFALAVLTAGAAPAKAAVVTWDLWIAYDDDKWTTEKTSANQFSGHWIDPIVTSELGISRTTEAIGSVTFNDEGCGGYYKCGPVHDPDFEISLAFEGTGLSFSTNDDFRYDGTSYTSTDPLQWGPAAIFSPFDGSLQGFEFNVPFAHGTPYNNFALNVAYGSIELYNLMIPHTGSLDFTVLRGTLCHNGDGEPGVDSHCYRGPDTGVVPIPGALPLFASGLVAMGLGAWRRRRSA